MPNNWFESSERELNEASRESAVNDGASWETWETDLVMQWDHSDEQLSILCEMLGRSRAAIRVHNSNVKHGRHKPGRRRAPIVKRTETTTTTTTTTYCYDNWPEDERSEWYQ